MKRGRGRVEDDLKYLDTVYMSQQYNGQQYVSKQFCLLLITSYIIHLKLYDDENDDDDELFLWYG